MLNRLACIFVKTSSAEFIVSMKRFPALLRLLLLGQIGEQDLENLIISKRLFLLAEVESVQAHH